MYQGISFITLSNLYIIIKIKIYRLLLCLLYTGNTRFIKLSCTMGGRIVESNFFQATFINK